MCYGRAGRTITLQKSIHPDFEDETVIIPAGISVDLPRRPASDQSATELTPVEREEMIRDLIDGFAAMDARLTIYDADDQVVYKAEPRQQRKGTGRKG